MSFRISWGKVAYFASQPRPFPSSLMIGCFAEATTRDVKVDQVELEDARWFSRDETRAMLEKRHPDKVAAPIPMAIAHHLIRAWASRGGLTSLSRLSSLYDLDRLVEPAFA